MISMVHLRKISTSVIATPTAVALNEKMLSFESSFVTTCRILAGVLIHYL